MKKLLIILSVVVFCFISPSIKAQWQQTNGPEGSDGVYRQAISSGGKVWLSTTNGVYSANGLGQNWNLELPNILYADQLFAKGDTIIITYHEAFNNYTSYKSYLIISTNNGTSWNNPILLDNYYNISNRFNFKNGKLFFENAWQNNSHDSIYFSNDLGLTFTKQFIHKDFSGFVESQGDVIAFATNRNQGDINLYLSFDQLNSSYVFKDTNYLMPFCTECIEIKDSNVVIVSSSPNLNAAVSNNLGQTITTVPILNNYVNYTTHFVNDTIIVLPDDSAIGGNIYASSDFGYTWNQINTPLLHKGFYGYNSFGFINAQNILVVNKADTGQGKFLSIYNIPNKNYTRTNSNGIKSSTINQIINSDTTIFCATDDGIYRSEDGGNNWSNISPSLPYWSQEQKYYIRKDTIVLKYISYYQTNYTCKTLHSFDGGTTWSDSVHFSNNNGSLNTFNILFNKVCFADSFKSLDFGNSWVLNTYNGLAIYNDRMFNDGNNLYSFSSGNGFLKYNFITNQWDSIQPTTINLMSSNLNLFYNVSKVNNKWFASSYESGIDNAGNYKSLYYSYNAADWYLCNTNEILKFNNYDTIEIFGIPVFCNNIYYSAISKYNIAYSVDGIHWKVGLNNNTKLCDYLSNIKPILATKNGLLYSSVPGRGLWKLSDTLHAFEGNVYIDSNNNAAHDLGETVVNNAIVTTSIGVTNTDSLGNYNILTSIANDTLKSICPLGYNSNPNYRVTSSSINNGYDFGFHAPTPICNYSVDVQSNWFRPGFSSNIYVNIQSLGTVYNNDTLELLLDTILTPLSFTITPDIVKNNTYKWHIPAMSLYQYYPIGITAQTSVSAIQGNPISVIATVKTGSIDFDNSDNVDSLITIIVGSFDPNEKICSQGNFYNLNNKKPLEYTIHFQNEGTAPTEFVKILDTLSNKLDWSTFKFLNSSSAVNYTINKNVVSFYFNPLHLQPKSVNELESQGFVTYSISPKSTIKLNDTIANTAYIYFDYNPAIVTNTTYTKCGYQGNLAIKNVQNKSEITVYPNPAQYYLQLNLQNSKANYPIVLKIIDNNGKIVKYAKSNSSISKIDIKNLANGLYYIQIVDVNNNKIGTASFIKKNL